MIDPRIMALVEVEPIDDGCWIWVGKTDVYDQPRITREGRQLPTRRVIYTAVRGPIPRGRLISVPCDDQLCVNPAHLLAVTKQRMILMAIRRGVIYCGPVARAKITAIAHERSRYGWDKVRQLRALTDGGMPVLRAAVQMGIGQSAAYKIASRATWKEIPTSPLALLARQSGMLP